jgi:hypothetical protein
MTADTRTTERTEARVETVTVEEVQCPVCQQWYADGDKLTVVGVGVDYESTEGIVEADHLTRVCTSCAESLFDVDVRGSSGRLAQIRGALSRPVVDLGGIEVSSSTVRTLVSIGITLTVTAAVASVGMNVASEMAAQVEASDVQEVGAPAFTLVEMVPMVLLVMLVALVTRLPGVFGGRFSR